MEAESAQSRKTFEIRNNESAANSQESQAETASMDKRRS